MSEAPELLPCPFCGGEAWLNDYEAKHSAMPARSRCPQCKSCGGSLGYHPTAAKAIAAWNRRADLVPAPGWQPIETAPRDGTAILASGLDHGNGPGRHYAVVEWMDFGCEWGWYPDEDSNQLIYLSHWMPLPAPPSEDKQ